jgi:hypothetical protein
MLPRSLQAWTFGFKLDQSSEGVMLPCSPQTWALGHSIDKSLRGVTLPSIQQTSALGQGFLPKFGRCRADRQPAS